MGNSKKLAINSILENELINITAASKIMRPWQEKPAAQKTISRRVQRDSYYDLPELEKMALSLEDLRSEINRFFKELDVQRKDEAKAEESIEAERPEVDAPGVDAPVVKKRYRKERQLA